MPKISELTIKTSPAGADVIPLVSSGTTYQGTLASLPISDATATALAAKALLAGSSTQDFAAKILTATTVTTTNSTVTNLTVTNQNGGQLAGLRNRVINGNFKINQRAVASASTAYGAGIYTVDRWKAGSGGCTMSFAASGNGNLVTITAGTLVQVVEDLNVEGGVYTLSWSGTATARVAINGAALSGAYAASPITTSSATAAQAISIEFSTGTVGTVQLEIGTKATPFEYRFYGLEFMLSQRYYESGTGALVGGYNTAGGSVYGMIGFRETKRIAPTVVLTQTTASNASGLAVGNYDASGFRADATITATGSGLITYSWTASAEL